MPLFCDTALAARIERAEARLIAKAAERPPPPLRAAGFVMPIAGGVASFAEPDSPFNKVAGLGFGGVPSAAALDEVEDAFAARGAPVQIELAHLGDPAIGVLLSDRGYALTSFENVLGRPSTMRPATRPARGRGPPERRGGVRRVAGRRGGRLRAPGRAGRPGRTRTSRATSSSGPSATSRRPGSPATSRCSTAPSPVARACTPPTASPSSPAPRPIRLIAAEASIPLCSRHGSPTPLRAGCDIAVVTTQPGSQSQENVQRHGFDLLYTRAILVKQA